MADKSVVRNAQYKRGGLNKRERHNERKNTDYQNGDIVMERAVFNVHFKQSTGGYESTFDTMISDRIISTRGLGKDPFIVDELVFDVNSAYFENHGSGIPDGSYEYAKRFYEEAYRYAVREVGGEQYVLSAVMHADERNKALSEQLGRDVFHYHLHVVYVPVIRKEIYFKRNNKNPELAGKLREVIMQVSHSKKWPRHKQLDENGVPKRSAGGKALLVNAYSLLQDHFFEHMRDAGFIGFERGERGSSTEHLSVLEYKAQQEAQRVAALSSEVERMRAETVALNQMTKAAQQQLAVLEEKTTIVRGESTSFNEIDRMGENRGFAGNIALSPDDWNTVSVLAKEGVKARYVIAELKRRLTLSNKKVTTLETRLERYEGAGLTDAMRYREAIRRAPRRMAEFIDTIMWMPPERQEPRRPSPDRNRETGLQR